MRSFGLVVIFAMVAYASVCGAETDLPSSGPWTLSLYFENDLFADTDQHYTNGIKLSWVSPDLVKFEESGRLPEWSHPWIRRLPFVNKPGLERNIVLSLGQSMYTPEAISEEDLVEEDRPYAGWAYLGIGFHSKNYQRLDSVEIQLGIVGPESFAEDTQKWVHEVRGIGRPNGWDNQLKNEPGLAFVYERKQRLMEAGPGMGFDAIVHGGGALGNVYTYLNAGMEARAGWNIPSDFGLGLIRPAGDAGAPALRPDPKPSENGGFSLHGFIRVDGRAVIHDVFLDGNTFTDSHSVDKKHMVAQASAGASVVFHGLKISYAHVFQTKEFHGQDENHSFGSITFSYTR